MKGVFLLLALCFLKYSKALECGIGKVNSDSIKETLSMCVKNNETLEKIWEMASATLSPDPLQDSGSDSKSMENEQPLVPTGARKTRGSRLRRATTSVQSKPIQVNERRQDETKTNNNAGDNGEDNATTEGATTSEPGSSETCVVQCVFEHLGMTGDNGRPEQSKVVEGLLKTAAGRELRIFLQESVDECFQKVDQENDLDSCAYSTKLVTCLADKGRLNCGDWPAGNLPL